MDHLRSHLGILVALTLIHSFESHSIASRRTGARALSPSHHTNAAPGRGRSQQAAHHNRGQSTSPQHAVQGSMSASSKRASSAHGSEHSLLSPTRKQAEEQRSKQAQQRRQTTESFASKNRAAAEGGTHKAGLREGEVTRSSAEAEHRARETKSNPSDLQKLAQEHMNHQSDKIKTEGDRATAFRRSIQEASQQSRTGAQEGKAGHATTPEAQKAAARNSEHNLKEIIHGKGSAPATPQNALSRANEFMDSPKGGSISSSRRLRDALNSSHGQSEAGSPKLGGAVSRLREAVNTPQAQDSGRSQNGRRNALSGSESEIQAVKHANQAYEEGQQKLELLKEGPGADQKPAPGTPPSEETVQAQ